MGDQLLWIPGGSDCTQSVVVLLLRGADSETVSIEFLAASRVFGNVGDVGDSDKGAVERFRCCGKDMVGRGRVYWYVFGFSGMVGTDDDWDWYVCSRMSRGSQVTTHQVVRGDVAPNQLGPEERENRRVSCHRSGAIGMMKQT